MIALIAAVSKNGVIGNKGGIPWKIPREQKRFKRLTTDNVVIMGRLTFESIGKILPDRENIVVSNTIFYDEDHLITKSSLQDAISYAKEKFPDKNIYIIGGRRLYEEAIPIVDKMYINTINMNIIGDTFFPADHISSENFTVTIDNKVYGGFNSILYEETTWHRIK